MRLPPLMRLPLMRLPLMKLPLLNLPLMKLPLMRLLIRLIPLLPLLNGGSTPYIFGRIPTHPIKLIFQLNKSSFIEVDLTHFLIFELSVLVKALDFG